MNLVETYVANCRRPRPSEPQIEELENTMIECMHRFKRKHKVITKDLFPDLESSIQTEFAKMGYERFLGVQLKFNVHGEIEYGFCFNVDEEGMLIPWSS